MAYKSEADDPGHGFSTIPTGSGWLHSPAPSAHVSAKSTDGKIWFVSGDGVSVLDPHHLPFNKIPPPVYIQQITADGKTYDASNGLRLPPKVRNLAIDYTALSLVAPEKVHFRFKLEGQDDDWREVANQRRVEYSNLPPGDYRFRVTACNNSGVWNDKGAVLDFVIEPAYYQTNWFRALCAAAFLALLWAAYRLRVRRLRHQEQKLRDVIETIPTFAWTALPDGSVDFANRHWEEYTGLSTGKTVGFGWEAAVHPEDLKRVATNGAPRWRPASPWKVRCASSAQMANIAGSWCVPCRCGMRGAKSPMVRYSTDIEDRKRVEQERERLRQLQADLAHVNRVSMMGELTASLAHELQQPIAATIFNASSCLRWLKRREPDLDEVREAANRIVRDGTRAGDLIKHIRSFYSKGAPAERELVDINELINEMLALLHSEANRYSISMRTDLAADLPKITADRVQLQQVLLNLMVNGIEAMKDTAGELTITSELGQDGQLLISVRDTGVGLPAENADQIFNAFFTTKPQGSGMGLAISRSIVESHGGRLWATPNSGRGATFYFILPIAVQVVQLPGTGTGLRASSEEK